jgi:uncharacterized protein
MLTLQRHTNASSFLQVTEAAFIAREVECGLIYGIAERLRSFPERYAEPPYLATVHDGPALLVAALMTPPRNLLLHSEVEDDDMALERLIHDLRRHGWAPPGVNCRVPLAHRFVAHWQAVSGQGYELAMSMRVFELRQVVPPRRPPGQLRLATAADVDLVLAWFLAFAAEAMPHEQNFADRGGLLRGIGEGNFYLWDDGGPVSMAVKGRRTAHGVSVGPVYTPPEVRGRGYATACVAALSQTILDEGWAFCTLFTDLANPTSNSIYQKIGYHPVCDFAEYRF